MANCDTAVPSAMAKFEESHAETTIDYSKTTSATSNLGPKFEYRTCALVYLRLLSSGKPFLLGSNVGELGKFDDIFIKDDQSHVFIIQLKHKENACKQQTLNKEEGDFSFSAYYKSYCEIEKALKKGDFHGNLTLVKDVPFDQFHFILFCNHPVKYNSINTLSHSFIKNVLSTGGSEEAVFSFNQDDPEVENFLRKGKDFKRRCKFLSKLIIFDNQVSADGILQLVKLLVAERTEMTMKETEGICSKYLQWIESWWEQRKRAPFLTECPPQWFADLDIRPSSILALESVVEFQGHKVPLSEICEKDVLTKDVLLAVRNRVKIRLGSRLLPPGAKCYVSRKLKHQTVLKRNILVESLDNHLLAVSNSPSGQKLASSAMRISDDRDEYIKVCRREVNRNVHWLSFQGELLVWRETYGDNRAVKSYVDILSDKCTQAAGLCSHEGNLVEKWGGKLRLVTGQSGMGKSFLLKHLALDRKKQTPCSWVVFVPLNDFTAILTDMSQSEVSFNKVVDLLHQACSNSDSLYPNLEKNIMAHSLRSKGNICIFLDAVDEVSPHFKDTVIELVQFIKEQTEVEELWVSTRRVLEDNLQDHLPSVPLVLQPFTQQQQLEYFHQCGIGRHEIEHVWQQLGYSGQHISSVPLHAQMLADIIPSLRSDTSDLNITLPNLYEKFFIMKHDIHYYYKKKQDRTNVCVEEDKDEQLGYFFHFHMNWALLALFDQDHREILNINPVIANEKVDVDGMHKQRLGIIEGVSYNSIKFVHISFAEYLVARWLKLQIEQELSFVSSNSRMYLLLIEWSLKNVQLMFDLMLADKCKLHQAVLRRDVDAVKELLIKRPEEVNQLDAGGRNALHIAVVYKRWDMIDLLLEAGCTTDTSDRLMGWRPISYADYAMSWKAMISLLRYEVGKPFLERFQKEVPEELLRQSIISAAKIGNKNVKRMFQNLDFNFSSFSEIDALYLLVAAGNVVLLKMLLGSGKKYLKKSSRFHVGNKSYSPTFLHEAVICENIKVMSFLLKQGAKVDARDSEGCTPLHYAARNGHLEAVKWLLGKRAKVLASDKNGWTALHWAAENNHLVIVLHLLDKGANVHSVDGNGRTPLHQAAKRGHLEIVQCLLAKGAHIEAPESYGKTAFHFAVEYGHLETVQYLFDQGANIMARDENGLTPLHWAAKNGYLKIVQYLSEKEVDMQASDWNGLSVLHFAVKKSHLEIVQLLLEKEVDVNATDKYGETALHWATKLGLEGIVKYLIENEATLQATDMDGRTPLHFAAMNGHLELVEGFLERGANVQATDRYKRSVLHLAAMNGHLQIVQCLLLNEADIHAIDEDRSTALHFGVSSMHQRTVQCLLENGADVNASDVYGQTALLRAAKNRCLLRATKNRCIAIVEHLLDRGADVLAIDKQGQTALHWAVKHEHLEIVQHLLECGSNVLHCDRNGQPALHWAVKYGYLEIVQCLLDKGADVQASEIFGRTALHWAARNGHEKVVQLLLLKGVLIESRDQYGQTALHYAVLCECTETVHCLLEKGANVEAVDSEGQTALHLAARSKPLDIVQCLLDKGANILTNDKYGQTALHLAVENRHLKMVQFLLKILSNTRSKDEFGGWAILLCAARNGHLETVQFLLDKIDTIQTLGRYNRAALHWAVRKKYNTIIHWLLTKQGRSN